MLRGGGGFSRNGRFICMGMVVLLGGRLTVEESVNQTAGQEQVWHRAQQVWVFTGRCRNMRVGGRRIGPVGGNDRPALVRQDQKEVNPTGPAYAPQDL